MLRHREGQTWECSDCGMAVMSHDGRPPKHTCTAAKAKIARGFESFQNGESRDWPDAMEVAPPGDLWLEVEQNAADAQVGVRWTADWDAERGEFRRSVAVMDDSLPPRIANLQKSERKLKVDESWEQAFREVGLLL